MKNIFRKLVPSVYYKPLADYIKTNLDKYAVKSYSQEGEDLILRRSFEKKEAGFYIDVGAHHPIRFSNTYLLYKKGWRGINIDAMPGSMKIFRKIRPRDISLEIPISDKNEALIYYFFNDSALNGFSKELSDRRDGINDYYVVSGKKMETKTLKEVLDKYISASVKIDFLSVDVEGLEMKVLRSNDWERYRPEIILVEITAETFNDIINCEIVRYLRGMDYEVFAKTFNTLFFRSIK